MGSGPFAVIFYGVQIFQKTGFNSCFYPRFFFLFLSGINAYLAAICVAIIRVMGGVLAIFLIKNIPRYIGTSNEDLKISKVLNVYLCQQGLTIFLDKRLFLCQICPNQSFIFLSFRFKLINKLSFYVIIKFSSSGNVKLFGIVIIFGYSKFI